MTTAPRRTLTDHLRVPAIGIAQIIAWGASFYLPAVLAKPTVADTGWPLPWVIGAFSLALLVSGLVSPRVGDVIEARGGRPVLATGAATIALGLVVMALAPNLALYVAAWAIVGAGMGAGLYDAAFAALGRLHGLAARREITNLTLVAGFASTVSWPLAAVFVSEWGWRGACLAFAALLVAVAVPFNLLAFPREARRTVRHAAAPTGEGDRPGSVDGAGRSAVFSPLFMLTAAAFTLSSVIASIVSVHLITLMEARGVALAAAVGFGALIGPAQVAARVVESLVGARYHPLWTMLASTLCVATGVVFLWTGMPALLAARLRVLRRRHGHQVDRARHAAPRPFRRRRLRAADGPHGDADPRHDGGLPVARRRADRACRPRRDARRADGAGGGRRGAGGGDLPAAPAEVRRGPRRSAAASWKITHRAAGEGCVRAVRWYDCMISRSEEAGSDPWEDRCCRRSPA